MGCQPYDLRAVRGRGWKRRVEVRASGSLGPSGEWGAWGQGALGQCGSVEARSGGCLRKEWVVPGTLSLLRSSFNSLEEKKRNLSPSSLRIKVEASLNVMNPVSRNLALKSSSNSVQMFLVYSLLFRMTVH